MRGITKPVAFHAKIDAAGGTVSVSTPSFKINRTDWGVNFNSTILKTAMDKLINDDVELTVSLQAAKG